jgi:hypothetical protein
MLTQFPPRSDTGFAGPKLICVAICVALAMAGLLLIAASFIPFPVLSAKVRGMSASGGNAFFDETFYAGMQLRLRLIGLGDLAASSLGLAWRRKIYKIAKGVLDDSARFANDAKSAAGSIPARDWLGLGIVTVIAGVLRIRLLSQPMRDDEASTFVEYIARPFYVTLSFYNGPDNHLFHTLLERASYALFGNHPWDLRLPALVAGLCQVPAAYFVSRVLYRSESGLLAAALVASSSILIEFSGNARGYGLFTLEVLLLASLAACVLRQQNRAAWFLIAILAGVGFYTMPVMLYGFGGIAIWMLLCAALGDARPDARGVVGGLVAASAFGAFVTLELYSPVFAVSGFRAVLANKWVKANPYRIFLHDLPITLASTWRQWMRDLPWLLMLVLVAVLALALLWHRGCGRQSVPLALGMLLWISPVVLIQHVAPYERVWLFLLPIFYITASAGIALVLAPVLRTLRFRSGMVLIAIAVALLLGLHVQRRNSVFLSNEGRGLEEMTMYLQRTLLPGDSVLVELPSDGPLLYYFKKHGVPPAYLNAVTGRRVLVVLNQVSGDDVEKVIAMTKHFHPDALRMELDPGSARLVARFDSASLYEVSTKRVER